MNIFCSNNRPATIVRGRVLLSMALICLILTACSDKEALYVDIRSVFPVLNVAPWRTQPLRVAVSPLQDYRETRHIGSSYGLFGTEMPITVRGDHVAEQITLALIDYYRRREGWSTWIDTPALAPPPAAPDLRLTGHVLTWLVEVREYLVTTKVTVTTRLNLELTRTADGKQLAVDIQEHAKHWLVGFDEKEIDFLLSRHLHGTADKFLKKAREEGWPVQPRAR